MFKEYFKKLIKTKRSEMDSLKAKSETSESVEELRAINAQLEKLSKEVADAEAQLAKIEEEERAAIPAGAQLVNGAVIGAFGQPAARKADRHDTEEYRNAFMEYVCRGTEIPMELRTDAVTGKADASAVIPTTMMREIIQKLETFGNVYAVIRKLNVQGGIAIPISSVKPEATWVGEGASESKKLTSTQSVTFSYFGVECKIAQTLLVNVVTIDEFQRLFVELATEAIVKAIEIAIFNGDGTTQPLGITNDTRVPAANKITMKPSQIITWDGWHKLVKSKMKKAYRNGTFFMSQATFDSYIDGMVDKNGQPIGRVNYGIDGGETYRFMGKAVDTVEDEVIPSFDDASAGDVVAVFMNPKDYALNSNLQMTVVKWTDHDTNEVKTKAIMICDGKLVDPNGVLLIKKGTD